MEPFCSADNSVQSSIPQLNYRVSGNPDTRKHIGAFMLVMDGKRTFPYCGLSTPVRSIDVS
jgi:hypothetical protein